MHCFCWLCWWRALCSVGSGLVNWTWPGCFVNLLVAPLPFPPSPHNILRRAQQPHLLTTMLTPSFTSTQVLFTAPKGDAATASTTTRTITTIKAR